MALRLCITVLFLASACAHGPRRTGGVDTLVGISLPLTAAPALRLSMAGQVDGRAAEVQLDASSAISLVTTGCFDAPRYRARVTVSDPTAPDETLPLTLVEGLSLGGTRLRAFDAALLEHSGCVVSLGLDWLADVAVEVSPSRRQVAFSASASREEWERRVLAEGGAGHLVPVSRDPTYDWPIVVARVRQGDAELTMPFVLGTRDWNSRIFTDAAKGARLVPALELLEARAGPEARLPELENEDAVAFSFERLELAPGVGVDLGVLAALPGSSPRGVAGTLSPDVWGRFEATLDLQAGLLVLRRPRTVVAGERVQCEGSKGLTDEACYVLTQSREGRGVKATVTVWRPLADGARLYLDVDGVSGPTCRLGVSFPAGGSGRSSQHVFPWKRLDESMPDCVAALGRARGVTLGYLEDGDLPNCPGMCGFAQDLRTGRLSCECQPSAAGLPAELERVLLQGAPARRSVEGDGPDEPKDP